MENVNINKLKNSTTKLYNDLDECIDSLITARKNKKDESEALFKMESLMVATMQQLTCIMNYLNVNENTI